MTTELCQFVSILPEKNRKYALFDRGKLMLFVHGKLPSGLL